jgi:flagellar biosynthesis repressor protein FlbT
MPLKLTMGQGERVVINGAVITNVDRRTVISVDNQAEILRGKDIMQMEDADTPAKEIYFLIQNGIIAPEVREATLPHIQEKMASLIKSKDLGSHDCGCIMEAANFLSTNNYYKALKRIQSIIKSHAPKAAI